MSNYAYGGSANFKIKKEHHAAVLSIMNEYNGSSLSDFSDIFSIFYEFGWDVSFDSAGNIAGAYFEYGPSDDDEEWLNLIAPYVQPGCYLEMTNEDGYRWAWYFDRKTCTEYAGDTHYYLMPDHSRIFTDERDPETPIPICQLKQEYARLILDGSIDPAEITFAAFLSNCMSHNNGTLTEII